MKLGLTGGMGCGKSTVGRILEEFGWRRVDADAIVRRLLEEDPEIANQLVNTFGPAVAGANGIDRAALGRIVFADAAALAELEAILHPPVRAEWIAFLASTEAAGQPAVVEIPLLHEKDLAGYFDHVCCVAAPLEIQLERLAARGVEPEEANRRIARQLPLDEKMRFSDSVLTNAGPMTFLRDQVRALHELLG